ncbi:MAG: YecA family protein [Halomonadaceae bacterium]|nr:MAG: YecA family protein [Halomonadaceae bacterium]
MGNPQYPGEEQEQLFDFDLWADLHLRHSAINHPSELHGLLSGQLAAGERLSPERWEHLVCEHLGAEQLLPEMGTELPSPKVLLQGFYDRSLRALQSESMDFRLLLPGDSAPLSQRLEALGSWVRGFLEGMARAAGEGLNDAPQDVRELIKDFVAISQIEIDEDDTEDGEKELSEVIEYVRIGVLNVFAEFNRPAPDDATLH